ncbi:tRNA pseudouridine(55) synthase TruB [Metamycoplasma buccale]|uniref:tRNA pseudouridine(55) synthase TruB n=1 Tax=Metamycoplasma buccale TaxID=55602 RepID=UPI00398F243A
MFFKLSKPRGISSFIAIKKFAKELNIKKIGHAGTLDPLAEGLLIVATDFDTKLLSFITHDDKEYYVKAYLNKSSASFDEGTEIRNLENKHIKESELKDALEYIKNQEKQTPPIFSAKKINGVRSYKLARENREITLKDQKIKIHWINLIQFDYEEQSFTVEIKVSKGTYIRSLIHDIGIYLNTDACVNILKRTKIGSISLENIKKYSEITNLHELFNVSFYMLDKSNLALIEKNNSMQLVKLIAPKQNTFITYKNKIMGYILVEDEKIKLIKIFSNRVNEVR